MEIAFRYTSRGAYVGEAIMKAPCDAKEAYKAGCSWKVDRDLEMLHNAESIQIKWLFRMERAISLTLDSLHLSVLKHLMILLGDLRENKHLLLLDLLMIFLKIHESKLFLYFFLPVSFHSVHFSASQKRIMGKYLSVGQI